MRVFTKIAALRHYLERGRKDEQTVGLLPTMGALHEGHLTLIERAIEENDIVVVSIFVNPMQFGPREDFHKYPRRLEEDAELCEEAGVAVVFAPTPEEMGMTPKGADLGNDLTAVVPPKSMTAVMCGRTRIGHFEGVATIVTKLLNVVQPDRAYFGQKDAQQLAIIQRLVTDLNMPVQIVPCATVRLESGLAMSSRNQYLSAADLQEAAQLSESLRRGKEVFQGGDRTAQGIITAVSAKLKETSALSVEYVELVHPVTLAPLTEIKEVGLLGVAAKIGSTRLIDNMILRHRAPIVAIDGPAGAGKSTVSRQVAHQLGLLYLDTGAMYRAVTWLVLDAEIPLDDEAAIAELISGVEILLKTSEEPLAPAQVWIAGQEVTQAIRTPEVTAKVSAIASLSEVRSALVAQQQSYGIRGGLVAEGRDIGTHVFPDADLKIFLTASVQERARRRYKDLAAMGLGEISLNQIEQDILERDAIDSNRAISPLRQAEDAIEIITDGLSIAEAIDGIVKLYHDKLGNF